MPCLLYPSPLQASTCYASLVSNELQHSPNKAIIYARLFFEQLYARYRNRLWRCDSKLKLGRPHLLSVCRHESNNHKSKCQTATIVRDYRQGVSDPVRNPPGL